MYRFSLILAALLLPASAVSAEEATSIPPRVQRHMEGMVGSWIYNGTWGDTKFSGEDSIRLSADKTAMITEGHEVVDGKTTHYAMLSGWDVVTKKILYRGFTSKGDTWAGEWDELSDGKWTGNAAGVWNDTKWKSPTQFEFKRDWMRYEDTTDGKPWVAEYTRNPAQE